MRGGKETYKRQT